MIVRVPDIPQEGLELAFDLDPAKLTDRLDGDSLDTEDSAIKAPAHNFAEPLPVKVKLHSDGKTVDMHGSIKGAYSTLCSRCAGEAREVIDISVNLIVKPRKNKNDEEDIGYALYDGEELDCNSVLEDLVVLDMPIASLCSEDCKGLCGSCGANLNKGLCKCEKVEPVTTANNPFAKLKDFKVLKN